MIALVIPCTVIITSNSLILMAEKRKRHVERLSESAERYLLSFKVTENVSFTGPRQFMKCPVALVPVAHIKRVSEVY